MTTMTDADCTIRLFFMPPLTKSSDRGMMFIGFSVRPDVHANSLCFLFNNISDWPEIFTINANPHAECFHDASDVIGHMVQWTYLII